MYKLLLQALFGNRAEGLGDEYFVAAKKIGYIEYSQFDKNNPELTDKGREKLAQLKKIFNPQQDKPKGGAGYEVEIKV